ncbi:MAG: tetratricopeptide repeat protein [Pseudomonadota bacterium]
MKHSFSLSAFLSVLIPALIPALLSALLVLPASASAQSLTVISASNHARNCSFAAENAALKLSPSREDVATCTRALEFDHLSPRDHAATLVNRGILLAAHESYQDALNDYNKAMTLRPELAEPYVGRGNLWFLAGRFDTAIDDYNKALDLMLGRSHLALFNRGLAYEKAGKAQEAIADYRQALALQPEFKLAQEKLAKLTTQ